MTFGDLQLDGGEARGAAYFPALPQRLHVALVDGKQRFITEGFSFAPPS